MSDKFSGFIVTFEKEVSQEWMNRVKDAVLMIKYVIDVEPIVADYEHHHAKEMARYKLRDELWNILFPERKI